MKRYIDNGKGGLLNEIITDTKTGLMWQKETAPRTYTWQEAVEYCKNLTLAGYDDWRLPTIEELFSIVDYERFRPAIDPVLCAGG